MTDALRGETETMEAGRSLDAAIAERVMGLRVLTDWFELEAANEAGETVLYQPKGDFALQEWEPEGDGGYEWSPSTYVQTAWLLVERMLAIGWACAIDVGGSADDPHVGVLFTNGGYSMGDADAATFPEAACRAALAALDDDAPPSAEKRSASQEGA